MLKLSTHIPTRNVTSRDLWCGIGAGIVLVASLIVREFYSRTTGIGMFVALMVVGVVALLFIPRETKLMLWGHLTRPEKTGWDSFLKYGEWVLVIGVIAFLIYRFFFEFRIAGYFP